MAHLTLHRKLLWKVGLPLWVFINEQPVGIMRGKEVSISLPAGIYQVSVRLVFCLFKWTFHIGGTRKVDIQEGECLKLEITDKERWWNILFDIDLVLWMLRFFITIPSPWDTVYEILSNGFFVLWLLKIWIIRNRYFILKK